MRTIIAVVGIMTLSLLAAAPFNAVAADMKVKSEVVMKVGNKVHLFHSGTADVKKEICLNDVLTVYRESMHGGSSSVKEVGLVKVLSYDGTHYFEAEVVKGEIRTGDIAKKDTAMCLVQPLE